MEVIIRAIHIKDAKDINEMRVMDGVKENILSITSERISKSEEFIESLGNNDHTYVAEIFENGKSKVVGICGLSISQNPRLKHCGVIGIMVNKNYQKKGIGRMLLEKVIDLADNWLMLVRLELSVFCDNERAINLYKSLGFVEEGIKKYAAIRNGKYDDEFIMARYNRNIV
ncbi:GNAT family N-acetyltransferase [Clostridium massiliamazoniense]|uniref:GNAT family N-acetyltransferase n=1 Tax=Clostridium massiliamazoniense TaxID=1347366 RepID=UPI0006D7AF0B|nr:GNAT family N-acetyltransferase [Clostridium massiliamazoniense]